MKKVLVTGAAGYIGRHVINLIAKEHYVRAMVLLNDNSGKAFLRKSMVSEIVEGNICIKKDVSKAVKGCECIIHLAAAVGSPEKNKNKKVNAEGTLNIVEAAKKEGVNHIIFTSSVSAIRKAKGPYGESKHTAENIIKESGINYTIFRPTLVYGDRSQGLGRIIRNIRRFPLFIPMVGKGSFKRQPIYVKDLAALVFMSVGNSKSMNKIYNAGGGEILSFRQLVKKVAVKMKKSKIIVPVPLFACRIAGFIFEKTMKKPFFTREHIRSLSEDTLMDVEPIKKDFGFMFTEIDKGLDETLKGLNLL